MIESANLCFTFPNIYSALQGFNTMKPEGAGLLLSENIFEYTAS